MTNQWLNCSHGWEPTYAEKQTMQIIRPPQDQKIYTFTSKQLQDSGKTIIYTFQDMLVVHMFKKHIHANDGNTLLTQLKTQSTYINRMK